MQEASTQLWAFSHWELNLENLEKAFCSGGDGGAVDGFWAISKLAPSQSRESLYFSPRFWKPDTRGDRSHIVRSLLTKGPKCRQLDGKACTQDNPPSYRCRSATRWTPCAGASITQPPLLMPTALRCPSPTDPSRICFLRVAGFS